jgi:hypothetical protein
MGRSLVLAKAINALSRFSRRDSEVEASYQAVQVIRRLGRVVNQSGEHKAQK